MIKEKNKINFTQTLKNCEGHMSQLLATYGVQITPKGRLNCINPKHHDENYDMSIKRRYDGKEGLFCHCENSGRILNGVDIFDAYQLLQYGYYEHDKAQKFIKLKELCECLGVEPVEYNRATNPKHKTKDEIIADYAKVEIPQAKKEIHKAYEYLQEREISEGTAQDAGLGFRYDEYKGWNALVIPMSESSYIMRNINTKPNAKYTDKVFNKGKVYPCFIERALSFDRFYICEGWADALSIYEVCDRAGAISLNGVSNITKLIEAFNCDLRRLDSKTIYCALDSDETGLQAQNRLYCELLTLQEEAKKRKIYFNVKIHDITCNEKDPNAALVANRKAFIEAINHPPLTIKNNTQGLLELESFIKQRANKPIHTTGFNSLDSLLNGGLYEGLYVLIGGTGGGKTAFAMQTAEAISASGEPVLYVAMEMTQHELNARALARRIFLDCETNGKEADKYGIDARFIMNYHKWKQTEHVQMIRAAQMQLAERMENLYTYDGMGNIGEREIRAKMAEITQVLGKPPVLIVDYLQIMKPNDVRATDKMNNDFNILALKHISRDYRIPVIALSSTARENYGKPLTIGAAKESGAIEYTSDVIVALELEVMGNARENKHITQTQIDEEEKKTPRYMRARILKNRYGQIKKHITIDFYPRYSCMIG